jgi:hypothetical protein
MRVIYEQSFVRWSAVYIALDTHKQSFSCDVTFGGALHLAILAEVICFYGSNTAKSYLRWVALNTAINIAKSTPDAKQVKTQEGEHRWRVMMKMTDAELSKLWLRICDKYKLPTYYAMEKHTAVDIISTIVPVLVPPPKSTLCKQTTIDKHEPTIISVQPTTICMHVTTNLASAVKAATATTHTPAHHAHDAATTDEADDDIPDLVELSDSDDEVDSSPPASVNLNAAFIEEECNDLIGPQLPSDKYIEEIFARLEDTNDKQARIDWNWLPAHTRHQFIVRAQNIKLRSWWA